MSTNLGIAPELLIAEIVGIAVFAAVIISSPLLIPSDLRAINNASVPLPTATPYLALYFFVNFFSNSRSSLPKKIWPLFKDLCIFKKIFFYILQVLCRMTKI